MLSASLALELSESHTGLYVWSLFRFHHPIAALRSAHEILMYLWYTSV